MILSHLAEPKAQGNSHTLRLAEINKFHLEYTLKETWSRGSPEPQRENKLNNVVFNKMSYLLWMSQTHVMLWSMALSNCTLVMRTDDNACRGCEQ